MKNEKNKTVGALKIRYMAPCIEVIEMENEGVMALSDLSGGNPALPGGNPSGSANRSRVQTTTSYSELDDLINDILTVKNSHYE